MYLPATRKIESRKWVAYGVLWKTPLLGAAGTSVKLFFLACVLIAGVYGALTVNKRILFVQALPAALALASVLLSR